MRGVICYLITQSAQQSSIPPKKAWYESVLKFWKNR
jgi:hypothetical protein